MIRLTLLCVALFLFSSALPAQTKGLSPEQKQFWAEITRHFYTIDTANVSPYFDGLDSANHWLIGFLADNRTIIQSVPDSFNYDQLYIAHAMDRKLTLVSWNTRRGGTMIEFTTMAIYKTPKDLESLMLLDPEHPEQPETFVHYNKITTLKASDGQRIYLAWGNGQGSTLLPWQEIRAFTITEKLNMPFIFPDHSYSIDVMFDLNKVGDHKHLPVIVVSKDGRTIDVPLTDDEDRFLGNYQRYQFNGIRFVKKEIIKKS
jgi:hypothetical protein